jgi:AcrR family transcriptional regulator
VVNQVELTGTLTARASIKQVAAQMIAERGYHATSLRQLANEAGVTLGTLYHYFPSKEDLLAELFDDAMRPLLATLDGVVERAERDPVGVLKEMIESFIRIALEELGTALVIIADNELRALSQDRLESALRQRDEYERAMLAVVEIGRGDGHFHVANPKFAVYAILAICNSVPRWYRPDGPLSADETAHLHADLALRVVGARSPGD